MRGKLTTLKDQVGKRYYPFKINAKLNSYVFSVSRTQTLLTVII